MTAHNKDSHWYRFSLVGFPPLIEVKELKKLQQRIK